MDIWGVCVVTGVFLIITLLIEMPSALVQTPLLVLFLFVLMILVAPAVVVTIYLIANLASRGALHTYRSAHQKIRSN